jgi:hypothetical protein
VIQLARPLAGKIPFVVEFHPTQNEMFPPVSSLAQSTHAMRALTKIFTFLLKLRKMISDHTPPS